MLNFINRKKDEQYQNVKKDIESTFSNLKEKQKKLQDEKKEIEEDTKRGSRITKHRFTL